MAARSFAPLHRRAPVPLEPPLPLFVYGALRPAFAGFARCLGDAAVRVRPAQLRGAVLLDNQQYPYAVMTSRFADVVTGELVTLDATASSKVLRRLDTISGCTAEDENSRWQRRRVSVRSGGVVRAAWVYVAADRFAPRLAAALPVVAGGDWARHVTSPWLTLHQIGRHGVGAHDGHGISWSTLDHSRGDLAFTG